MAGRPTRIEKHYIPTRSTEPASIVVEGAQPHLEQLESILDSLTEFVCRVDRNGIYTYVNSAYVRLTKRTREELLGHQMLPLIYDQKVRELLEDLLANPRPMKHKHKYEMPDGSRQYEEWTEELIYDPAGNLIGIQSVGRDITDEVLAEEARQLAEANYRLLARHLPDTAVFIYDHDLRLHLAEGPLLTRPGVPYGQLEGQRLPAVTPQTLLEIAEPNLRAALTGEQRHFEFTFGDVHLLASATPIQDEGGQVIRGLILVQDVTERQKMERDALQSALEHETAALLAGFIRDTSHDLRTPLSVIVTNTYLLRRSSIDRVQADRLDVIDQQVKRLERLINELHLMSSLDATESDDLNRQSLDLHQLILEVAKTNNNPLAEKHQTLVLHLDAHSTPILNADESQLVLVVMNLIENAHLYSAKGMPIEVRTQINPDNVILQVIDQGEGIEARHLPHIFDRFYKVDAARSTNRGGAGLGLAIVRRIVTLHGGSVHVESVPGQGSTFTIELPLNPTL